MGNRYTYDRCSQGPAENTKSERLQKCQDIKNVEPVYVDCAAHQVNYVRTIHG